MKADVAELYNVMVSSFTPASSKGIMFLTGQQMVEANQGALFGEQMAALANCWKEKFGGEDPPFIYTIPAEALAPKITKRTGIKCQSFGAELDSGTATGPVIQKLPDQ